MRHRKDNRKLGRTVSHRKALLSNLAASLFVHKHVKTTTAKAKEVQRFAERLISFAKRGSLADRRQVLRFVRDRQVVKGLFDEIAPQFKDRNGGYTRVIKLGQRRGDGAEMALVELVGYEGILVEKQQSRAEEKAEKEKKKEEKSEE